MCVWFGTNTIFSYEMTIFREAKATVGGNEQGSPFPSNSHFWDTNQVCTNSSKFCAHHCKDFFPCVAYIYKNDQYLCEYFEREWSTMFAFFLQLLTIDWWNHLNQVHVVSCARLAVHCAAVWQQSRITDAWKGFFHTYFKMFWTIGKIGRKRMYVLFCYIWAQILSLCSHSPRFCLS